MLKLTTGKVTRCKSRFGALRRKPNNRGKIDSHMFSSKALMNRRLPMISSRETDLIRSCNRTQITHLLPSFHMKNCIPFKMLSHPKRAPNISHLLTNRLFTSLSVNRAITFSQKRYYATSNNKPNDDSNNKPYNDSNNKPNDDPNNSPDDDSNAPVIVCYLLSSVLVGLCIIAGPLEGIFAFGVLLIGGAIVVAHVVFALMAVGLLVILPLVYLVEFLEKMMKRKR